MGISDDIINLKIKDINGGMMHKVLLFFTLMFFGFSFGDKLFINKNGLSTYQQEEEFMVADGENVIGPIFLKPIAKTDSILIDSEGVIVEGYFLEHISLDWKENLIGKFVSVEGEGRVVKGDVIEIKDKFIMVDTKNGFVISTLPKFPSRIKSPLKWNELFSPQITLKVKSDLAQSQIFKITYPVDGLSWKAEYILKKGKNKTKIIGFINIKNKTPVEFKNVTVFLIENNKKRELGEIHIDKFGEKKIKIIDKYISEKEILDLPDGKVSIFEDGIFRGYKKLKNGKIY